ERPLQPTQSGGEGTDTPSLCASSALRAPRCAPSAPGPAHTWHTWHTCQVACVTSMVASVEADTSDATPRDRGCYDCSQRNADRLAGRTVQRRGAELRPVVSLSAWSENLACVGGLSADEPLRTSRLLAGRTRACHDGC